MLEIPDYNLEYYLGLVEVPRGFCGFRPQGVELEWGKLSRVDWRGNQL